MRRDEEEELEHILIVKSNAAKGTGSSHAVLLIRSCLAFEHGLQLLWHHVSRYLLLRQAFVVKHA